MIIKAIGYESCYDCQREIEPGEFMFQVGDQYDWYEICAKCISRYAEELKEKK